MKNFVKYGLVGLTGYLVGFYEMKYKTMRSMLKVISEKESSKSSEENEAQ